MRLPWILVPGAKVSTWCQLVLEEDAVTLDVVVESAIMVPVLLQEAKCVVIAEVLKLNETAFSIPERK